MSSCLTYTHTPLVTWATSQKAIKISLFFFFDKRETRGGSRDVLYKKQKLKKKTEITRAVPCNFPAMGFQIRLLDNPQNYGWGGDGLRQLIIVLEFLLFDWQKLAPSSQLTGFVFTTLMTWNPGDTYIPMPVAWVHKIAKLCYQSRYTLKYEWMKNVAYIHTGVLFSYEEEWIMTFAEKWMNWW